MVPGPPPALKLLSGIAPVSQIMAPFGWAIRKHTMDIVVVATSSFLSW